MGKRHVNREDKATMNEDQLIVHRLHEVDDENATFDDPAADQPDVLLAKALDIGKSTFSEGINNEKVYLREDRLTKIASKTNTFLKDAVRKEVVKILFVKIASVTGFNKSDLLNILDSTPMEFLSRSSTAIIILTDYASISDYLPALTTYNSLLTELVLVIPKHSLPKSFNDVEAWAYGNNGDFQNSLNIRCFEINFLPEQPIIGGVISGKFIGLVEHEGLMLIPDDVNQLLQEELELLLQSKSSCQVLNRPESRLIERLRRDLSDGLTPALFAFLADQIVEFESAEKTLDQQASDTPLKMLRNIMIPRAEVCLGIETAQMLQWKLEEYQLME